MTDSHYIRPDRVFLGENTRKEIRHALEQGQLKAALIPLGAIEQHNEHLTLNVDIVISTFLCQQTALQMHPQVTVAPGCPVGYSPYHMARKGTLTLRKETLQAYLYDVICSLKTHGMQTVLTMNGHGGNTNLLSELLPQWREELDMTLDEISYFPALNNDSRAEILQGYHDLKDGRLDTVARQTALNHASEEETALMLAICPERVRPVTMEEYDQKNLDYAHSLTDRVRTYLEPFSKEGWPQAGANPENPRDRARQEDALNATTAKGEQLIGIFTRYIADHLQQMIQATEAGDTWPPV